MKRIVKMWFTIQKRIKEWVKWQDIINWAYVYHPAWVQLATQTKRPEIQKTYRDKILRAYYDKCWYE